MAPVVLILNLNFQGIKLIPCPYTNFKLHATTRKIKMGSFP